MSTGTWPSLVHPCASAGTDTRGREKHAKTITITIITIKPSLIKEVISD